MELDRSSIEKHDFPLKRRGYDPDAVERHLAALADAVERRSERPESLATTASDRVRGILDAAERGAAELTLEAESERRRILEQAHVEVGRQLERVAVLEREIDALLEAVRASATRLREELRALEGTVGELQEPESAPAPPDAAPSDDDGARLVALNMALNGTPREETERYLTEHFGAQDVDGLLDDVYVRAGQ